MCAVTGVCEFTPFALPVVLRRRCVVFIQAKARILLHVVLVNNHIDLFGGQEPRLHRVLGPAAGGAADFGPTTDAHLVSRA